MQREEKFPQGGRAKGQQQKQGAAQPFLLAGEVINEDLVLHQIIEELGALPVGFDAGHPAALAPGEEVLEGPGI